MRKATTSTRPKPMGIAELLALPVSVDVVTAGRAFGLGRSKAYELAKAGEFPCTVLKVGVAYRVTRAELLRVLGVTDGPLSATA